MYEHEDLPSLLGKVGHARPWVGHRAVHSSGSRNRRWPSSIREP